MKGGALQIKSFAFAVRVVNLNKFLSTEKKEFVISKQLPGNESTRGENPGPFTGLLAASA